MIVNSAVLEHHVDVAAGSRRKLPAALLKIVQDGDFAGRAR